MSSSFEAFEAALQAKTAVPEEPVEEEPEAVSEEESAPDERVRDDKGRFVKQADEEETEPEPAEELILGRFKSPEELAKSYQELERRLTEQGQEVGELRKIRSEFDALKQEFAGPAYEPNEFQTLLDEDPAHAAQLAYQSGDQHGLARAWAEWSQQDPASAAVWLSDIRTNQAIEQVRRQYEQTVSPLAAENQNAQIARGWQAVQRRHPDMEQFGDALLEAAKTAPEIVTALQSGTAEDAERMFENLYWMTKGRQGDTLKEAVQQAASETAEEARQAKAQATVVSASSTQAEEEKGVKERFAEALLQAGRPSIQEELYRTTTRQ